MNLLTWLQQETSGNICENCKYYNKYDSFQLNSYSCVKSVEIIHLNKVSIIVFQCLSRNQILFWLKETWFHNTRIVTF